MLYFSYDTYSIPTYHAYVKFYLSEGGGLGLGAASTQQQQQQLQLQLQLQRQQLQQLQLQQQQQQQQQQVRALQLGTTGTRGGSQQHGQGGSVQFEQAGGLQLGQSTAHAGKHKLRQPSSQGKDVRLVYLCNQAESEATNGATGSRI